MEQEYEEYEEYEELEVFGTWIVDGRPEEEFIGSITSKKSKLPDELEIDGVVYYPKK